MKPTITPRYDAPGYPGRSYLVTDADGSTHVCGTLAEARADLIECPSPTPETHGETVERVMAEQRDRDIEITLDEMSSLGSGRGSLPAPRRQMSAAEAHEAIGWACADAESLQIGRKRRPTTEEMMSAATRAVACSVFCAADGDETAHCPELNDYGCWARDRIEIEMTSRYHGGRPRAWDEAAQGWS